MQLLSFRNFQDQYHILSILVFSMFPILFVMWSVRKSYLQAINYRRWVEGLGLEPPYFFDKEVKSGLLRMEDIIPELLMAGPVAGNTRKQLIKMKRKNVARIMGTLNTAAAAET